MNYILDNFAIWLRLKDVNFFHLLKPIIHLHRKIWSYFMIEVYHKPTHNYYAEFKKEINYMLKSYLQQIGYYNIAEVNRKKKESKNE